MINIRRILDAAGIAYPSMSPDEQWNLFEEAFYMLNETHDTTKWSDGKLERELVEYLRLEAGAAS